MDRFWNKPSLQLIGKLDLWLTWAAVADADVMSRLERPFLAQSAVFCLACMLALAGCSKTADNRVAKPGSEAPSPRTNTGVAPLFVDVARDAGLDFVHHLRSEAVGGAIANILDSDGSGAAVLDIDGDGWMDIYLVNSGELTDGGSKTNSIGKRSNRLYRNLGNGKFEDFTEKAGVAGRGYGVTAAAADYDNDGDTDLFVVNFDGCILYRNEANGSFRDVTAHAGITTARTGISATFLDVDNDDYVDLFVANYLVFNPAIRVPPGSGAPYPGPLAYEPEFNVLYRNRGDGTFEDVSQQAGILVPGHRAMSVTALDFDLDGDPDLYVSNDGTPNLLFVNDGHGHFTEEGLVRGVGFNQFGAAEGSMAGSVADCNGDGLPDMFVTRFGMPSLYLNGAHGIFEDRASAAGIVKLAVGLTSWGGNFLDFDNDGWPDLFIANGDPHFLKGMQALLLRGDGHGVFSDASSSGGAVLAEPVNARGSGVVDFDNDGRQDIVVCTLGGPVILLQNTSGRQHHWLTLHLEGSQGNRDGFGALVKVVAGARTLHAQHRCPTSYVFQSDPRLHFGLGSITTIDRVEIRWPTGQTQVLSNVVPDQILHVREPGEARRPRGQTQ